MAGRKPRQSSLASQSRRAMSLPNDPRVRRSSQGFSDQFKFFIGPGLRQNEFGELQVDFDAVCERCGTGGGPTLCPPGFHRDPTTGMCVEDPIPCPPRTIFNPVTGKCEGPDTCPPGMTWDPDRLECVKIGKEQMGSVGVGCGCGEKQMAGAFLSGGRPGSEDILTWMAL